jgi:glycosyltransferase involved in cell wall biosynthesis
MPRAAIVYWYDAAQMRYDGGGQRVLSWQQALESCGYQCEVHGLRTIGGGMSKGARLSAAKRSLLPMPFARSVPDAAVDADLVVATVPAVFGDALDRIPHDRLVLDWMDLWSVNAKNVGDAGWLSRPGGRAQSLLWARREARLSSACASNVYAGYGDFEQMRGWAEERSSWVPTPIRAKAAQRSPRTIRKIGFIGNLDYPPNQLSLRRFLEEYARPLTANHIELVVAGYGSDQVSSWGYDVSVLGVVPSVEQFYSSIDAAVVPIHHGGGIKVKAVEALAFRLPVFGTAHVESGFCPSLRTLIQPMEQLKHRIGTPMVSVERQAAFEQRFSQSAFNESVRNELMRMSAM